MTPAEIDAMPAGLEMDARVASLVMHLDDVKTYPHGRVLYRIVEDAGSAAVTTRYPVPPYSTSDAAALEVLKRLGAPVQIVWCANGSWTVWKRDVEETDDCPTLALAICRAALKATLA